MTTRAREQPASARARARGSVRTVCRKISALTEARYGLLPAPEVVGRLNRVLLGWANYFCLGQAIPAYAAIDAHATKRLRQWLCRKHKVKYGGVRALPGREAVAGQRLGTPACAEAQLRVSEGMISNESRVREIRTLGSMSGERKRGQGGE